MADGTRDILTPAEVYGALSIARGLLEAISDHLGDDTCAGTAYFAECARTQLEHAQRLCSLDIEAVRAREASNGS